MKESDVYLNYYAAAASKVISDTKQLPPTIDCLTNYTRSSSSSTSGRIVIVLVVG